MKPETKAVGEVISYATAIGYEYNGWVGESDTRFLTLYLGDTTVTIACWTDREYFTTVSNRRVSNVEGLTADQSVPYVDAEDVLTESVARVADSEVRIEPIRETVSGDAVEYLDGVRARSMLFVFEDDFSMSTFHKHIKTVNDASRTIFMEIIDEFDLDLDPSDEAAAEDDEPSRTAFQ